MTTVALSRETSLYWDYIKNASNQSKLALITLLSSSISGEEVNVVSSKPTKVRRFSAMTDEEMELAMQGEPTAIDSQEEANLTDFVSANKGRIIKGLEKWL